MPKRSWISVIGCLVLLSASRVGAQERLDLYADSGMSQCGLSDTSPGLKFVYVVLNGPASASGVGFIAPRPDCWQGATWVTDILPGPRGAPGNTQTEFFTTLSDDGGCKTGPLLVCTMLFSTAGTGLPCCEISVAPMPKLTFSGGPLYYVECGTFDDLPLSIGQKVTINPNDTCPCNQPLATEPTTWGRVKSLYR